MRYTRLTTALSTALALTIAGCSEGPEPVPTGPLSASQAQPTCQTSTLFDVARRYLHPSQRDLARTLIAELTTLVGAGDQPGATDKGFDILALIETSVNLGPHGTTAQGSAFANAVLACMAVGPVTLPIDFRSALGTGGFAVRGGPNDPAGPILSQDDFAGIGVLPATTWPVVLGQRALIYGAPDPNPSFNEMLVGTPYEWSSLPALPVINPGAVMGLCVANPGQLRVERVLGGSTHSILALRDPSFFLACPAASAARQMGARAGGPVGGSATGFSDFGPVDALGITLSYVRQPSTVRAGARFSPGVRLLAQGAGGTPLPEVTIQITLVRISGTGNLNGNKTLVTGTAGAETFMTLSVSSPGTYMLTATASLEGYPTVQLQSATFTVTP